MTTPGISQYTSHAIEASARNEPYTIFVEPRTRVPIIYIREAAEAIVKLAAAPADRIQTVVYLLAGTTPTPTAQDLADAIRARLPHANLDFQPDPAIQAVHDARRALASIDDTNARREWAWRPTYDLDRIVDEMVNRDPRLRIAREPPLGFRYRGRGTWGEGFSAIMRHQSENS